MEKPERGKLHFKIVYKIGGKLFAGFEPIAPLPLGESYTVKITAINKRRDDLLNRMLNYLSKLDDEQMANSFSADGSPKLQKTKIWATACMREIENDFARLPIWYSTTLFRTKSLADFEHWARSEFLSVDEVVWLSVGLEPTEDFKALINPYRERGYSQKLDSVAEYMSRHKEVIRRKFDPYNQRNTPDLANLYDWIKAVKLDVHPNFLAMLETRIALEPSAEKPKAAHESSNRMDGRERQSMSKLIAAMAIDCYGYDPRARRSDIPHEIQGIANRLGLDISSDTIRKYLRGGAELIPEDWEPE